METVLSPFTFTKGPSKNIFERIGLIAILPDILFLFPSFVVTLTIADVRSPYSAPKPPLITSALRIASVSNTEYKPIE